MKQTLLVAAIAAVIPTSYAWGQLGHYTVALVAQKYVSTSTAAWVKGILADTSTTYMANVATWADSYRYTTAGAWSAPLHFIDAEDSPPSSCNVDYNRDCGATGCVVSAIKNYTTRLRGSSYTAANKLEAMKFMIHVRLPSAKYLSNTDMSSSSVISINLCMTRTSSSAATMSPLPLTEPKPTSTPSGTPTCRKSYAAGMP
jgi:hypothetical protein